MKKYLNPIPSRRELLLGGLYLAFQWLLLPTLIVLLLGDRLSVTRLNAVLFTINFALEALIFRRFLMASLDVFLHDPKGSLLAALQGFGLHWLGGLVLSYVILAVDPDFANVNDANISAMVSEDFGLMALCTVVLAPIAEELLYRGILFGGLYNRSPLAAFCLSTAVFSLIHIAGYVGLFPPRTLLLCFLQYLPAGLALAWSWTRSGTILSPILMHIAINAIGILAMR